ncbi:copper-translocating P-type ATPase [Beutenbergia cavernae DSM 12333]|uniref:Copper-translocating P-type ATPase n=1 Tax=Beutenbergia cavernae (strain ATCC BAA-8 / DSM 12333 / CCUG 43141 / JCM 11478 / NBRC 16432 / NCIMB 13614 / HKI 0122) TaxID=471853 RepID=C5C0B8_BEUC1|nr:heavy metal translocating P-type ATPase [Beutenbergia cavernae]ACQ79304.1 copper-translocating P-type ATPase [Beutenbergia cavernae DSM 12333]
MSTPHGHDSHRMPTTAEPDHGSHAEHAGEVSHDVGVEPSAHAGHEVHAGHAGHGGHAGHAGHEGHAGHAGHAGHGGHAGHVAQFRTLFWVMLAVAVPVVAFSPMFADLLGYHLPDATWVRWVSPVLGTLVYVWGGRPFLSGAVDELRARKPGMMLLIALAITVAFFSSWGATLGLLPMDLDAWWELALLVVIMLLGHWIEMRSLAASSSALDQLAALLPDEAERVTADGGVETVAPAALGVGDVVVVRPGGRVPADGEVTDGAAHLDESMITGESVPVRRGVGDRVVAGTVATDSGLRVRVDAVGEDTALAGISRLVAEAQASTSRAQRLADRAAAWLFWYALGAAAITIAVWSAIGEPDAGLIRLITVLVIACPHALGLAIPLVVAISTERAAKAGILVTDRLALERMRTVDVVLFDKTGTLTEGRPAVTHVLAALGTEDDVLARAAAAEADSEHPLAAAIVRSAQERGLDLPASRDFTSTSGVGVEAEVDGVRVAVGGPALLEAHGAAPLDGTHEWAGATVLHVLADGVVIGALALADAVRPQAREAVDALHARGIEVAMITGDAEPVAKAVAAELGIDRVLAGVKPQDKGAEVGRLQAGGRTVAMVGDGVNDAPALAQADVGLAIGAGTDVAIASAGVVLASDDPRSVLSVVDLSRASYRKMKQNLWWAAGYNIVAVPLAAGVLAPWGFVMPMAAGALLMSASTVIVALNAQTLRRLDLRPEAVVAGSATSPREREAHTVTR